MTGAELDNPAQMAADLAALFPPGVYAAELTKPADPGLLLEEERQCIAHCADKRIRDFTGGRLCARRVLAEVGIRGVALLPGKDRVPLWPESVTGSITHTSHARSQVYYAAVGGRRSQFRCLGLDAESMTAVEADLWPRICTPVELAYLERLAPERRVACAGLVFAAKEAFYKCQYPLTQEFLDFEDVLIETQEWQCERGSFRVLPQRQIRLQEQISAPLTGRFCFRWPFVMAGVAWPVST